MYFDMMLVDARKRLLSAITDMPLETSLKLTDRMILFLSEIVLMMIYDHSITGEYKTSVMHTHFRSLFSVSHGTSSSTVHSLQRLGLLTIIRRDRSPGHKVKPNLYQPGPLMTIKPYKAYNHKEVNHVQKLSQ